jgi:hypothetical protein
MEQTMTGAGLGPTPKVVSAGHVHYDRIIAIPIEHPPAPGKERGIRNDVVLKDNSFRNLSKRPIESAVNALTAAHVGFCKVAHHVARPVQLLYYCPRGATACDVLGVAWTGAVGDQQDEARPNMAEDVNHARESFRSIKQK